MRTGSQFFYLLVVFVTGALFSIGCAKSPAPSEDIANLTPVADQSQEKRPADKPKPPDEAQLSEDFVKIAVPFLQKHCYHCHGPDKKKAGIAFHLYKDEPSIIKDRKVWHSVQEMVQAGEMPPMEKPRPTVQETDAFLQVMKDIFARADRTAKRDPGRVTMRRLNRVEYKNTIRDLLGVFFDVNDLPQDDVGYGFDNIGDVLTMSPLLMERYLAAAESIVPRAFPAEIPKPETRRQDARFLEPAIKPKDTKGARPVTKGKLHTPWTTSLAGEYKLRVRCYAEPLGKDPVRIALEMDGKDLETFEVKAVQGNDKVYETTFKLAPGDHRGAVRFLNDFEEMDKKRTLHVFWLELVGPLDPRTEFQAKILDSTAKLDKKARTRAIFKTFASRAYRRPASTDEVERLAKLVEKFESKGDKWENALQIGFEAVLCSPKFLFRVELDDRPDSADPHPIDDHQLASRLSYFLWSSMPDDELLALAEKKQLHQNLDKQVRRLLKDPRSEALVDNFGMQWLQLRNLKTFAPDPKTFPDWDEPLRLAMLKETELFLQTVMREDRSILDLIDADFTFMNERLGKHYGIVDTMGNRKGNDKKVSGGIPLRGPEFKRVKLQGSERGGILTQASVLTVNSNPTRTSPVKRGRWVLEQILGTPPPPPPADVPELEEGDKAQTKGSLRQRMEQHRANPSCAFCHARMDPIGFAFENFNGIGQFRTKDGDFPIDPAGVLPNGQSFKGPGDLKAILKGKKDLFGRSLTEKMLTYGTGRGLEYYDRAAIDTIVAELGRNDYRFSVLVTAIVQSDPFRLRRGKDQK
jgi:hypothetical protein